MVTKAKLLITGCNGMLGANAVHHAARRFRVVASSRSAPVTSAAGVETLVLDITDPRRVAEGVAAVRPEVILHCAAETRVDFCEEHPEVAMRVNADGTRHLARAAAAFGATVVYLSSDSMFDGQRGGYSEDDASSPINVYSKAKLAGEGALRQEGPRHLIVRTNMYGWNMVRKESLAEWVLGRLRRGDVVPGFCDVVFAPLLVNDLADILCDMIEQSIQGTYHVCARDHVSKFDFARRIAQVFGLDPDLVHPSRVDESTLRAPRPRITYLDVSAVEATLGRPMPTVEEGLRRFRRLEENGYVAKLRTACRASVPRTIGG